MNHLHIIVQAKGDPQNLLNSKAKTDALPEGMTVVLIEGATSGGQLGIEFIFKGRDIYGNHTIMGYTLTENNFEALMGSFIGVRMRFGRMPADEFEIVRHYVKQQVKRFIDQLPADKQAVISEDLHKWFRI